MRRSFVRTIVFCGVCLALVQRPSLAGARQPVGAAKDTLRVAALATNDSSGRNFQRGVELGVAELKAAGDDQLDIEMTQSYVVTLAEIIRAAADAVDRGAVAVISFMDEPMTQQLARYLTQMGVIHLNARDDADNSRRLVCARFTFHVAPSARMSSDARRLAPAPLADEARVVAWHASLERDGAGALNQAYRQRFSRDATAEAWLGWSSVKILYEARSRAGSGAPVTLRDHLEAPGSRFDVRKGLELTFRSWDHQLRQPLYLVDGVRVITEVPRDSLLDAIGDGPGKSRCEWTW